MHGLATLKGMSDTRWARYVRRTSGDAGGSEIEQKTGIGQSTVSRWFTGTTPSPAHAARFAQAYGANVLGAFVAAGFLTEDEAGIPPRPQVDFYGLVDEDPHLSLQAKIHLKNQYGLLKAASAHGRAAQTRELIANDPEIDAATKARLMAHFQDVQMDVVYSSTAIVEHPSPETLSAASDTPDLAIAAHEEAEPIAGEQESPTEA
jgi:transcriptional regulator with XRE-family HTH domain